MNRDAEIIERLVSRVEKKDQKINAAVRDLKGMARAIESGVAPGQLARMAHRIRRDLEAK